VAEENTPTPASTIKDLELDGYKFKVDTDLLDDVEAFEYIDRIENKGQTAGIVPLLKFLVGETGYEEMKVHFAKVDAEEHKDSKDYKGRFRISKLNDVYVAIIEKFDPKD
jgi:hypothetical protein